AAPSVTINQAVTQSDPATMAPIHFTAVFSEPVTGFTNTGVTLTGCGAGSPGGAVANVYDQNTTTPDHQTYDIRVNGMPATSCTDPDNGPWTYTINRDDGNAVSTGPASPAPSTFQATHSYLNPGVYTINVCVKDATGANGCASVWVVVYDPNGGFVTGGGWLN